MRHSFEEINAAPMMALNNKAISTEAIRLVALLTEQLLTLEERKRQRKASYKNALLLCVELVIGDLFKNHREDAAGWVYRSLDRNKFTDELIGHTTFITVIKLMEQDELIESWKGGNIRNIFYEEGKSSQFHPGLASRFRATSKLITMVAQEGLTFKNAASHFQTALPRQTIHLRAKKKTLSAGRKDTGAAMKVPQNDQTAALKSRVQTINSYLAANTLEGGLFAGYIRRFSEGDDPDFNWDRGGRLYAVGSGSYQLMKKAERLHMRINGHSVAEIDISASYLTILHSLLDAPLPSEEDLYDVNGLPREVVKAFVTATIGNNKFHNRWPVRLSQELKKDGIDISKLPMRYVQERICDALPVFDLWQQQPISWSKLMFLESEQMIATMEALRNEHDIPSYSVHDSIIIPASDVELCAEIMKQKFEGQFGVKYKLKAHLPEGHLIAF